MTALATLWKIRNFRTLFAARIISNLGNGMAPTAVAFGILGLAGASASSLSLVLAVQSFALVVMLPFGGVWADRIGRIRVISTSDIVLGGLITVQAMLFLTHRASVPILVPFALMFGVLNALWYPAFPGLVPAAVPPEHMQSANSVISAGSSAAMIGGSSVAGILVASFGAGWAMAFDALTFIVAGILVWTLRHLSPPQRSGESTWSDLKTGWGEFRRNRWVFVIVVAFAFILMGFQGANGVLGPVLMKNHFDGAKSWALIATIESIGFLVGALVALRIRPAHPLRIAMVVMLTFPLFALSLAIPMHLAVIAACAFACGLGTELFQVLWLTALQKHVPPQALSRVSSYDAFGSMLFGPIGTAVAGPVSLALGLGPALYAAAGVMFIAILVALLNPAVWRLSDRM